jgi:formylglycine-generating enzyme required for sulfatase activity
MEFMLILAGEFDMGSPSELHIDNDERPVHHVNITKSFYLGKFEVTQKQWVEVMGSNPSHFKGDDRPVEQISWKDVQEFVRKLNAMEGDDKYCLPSEAEWEYACRAGTTTRYSFDNNELRLGDYAWYADNSGSKTHPVGQKNPNPWGLYDMHGNVWEWVQDNWHYNYEGAPTDGSAWDDGSGPIRIFRGGSWNFKAWSCRSADRSGDDWQYCYDNLGFRLLREV